MFVTAALAQSTAAPAAAGAGGINDLLIQFAPILLLVVIFWLLIFRPQQKRAKAQQAMLSAISRGDTVVTTGGIVGKVTKAVDGEDLEVEIAQGVARQARARHDLRRALAGQSGSDDNKAS